MKTEQIKELQDKGMGEATGCTEPMAVAYAAAVAAKTLADKVTALEVVCSKNILKNVKSVGIPAPKGCKNAKYKGVDFAAALGALFGDSDKKLDLLAALTVDDHEKAKDFAAKNVVVAVEAKNHNPLYIEVKAQGKDAKNTARVVIENDHLNIVKIEKNDKLVFEGGQVVNDAAPVDYSYLDGLLVADIIEYVKSADADLSLFKRAISFNGKIASEGLKNDYGLRVGKTTYGKGWKDEVVRFAAAGADARMAGAPHSVITNSGSGNRGLIATNTVVAFAKHFPLDAKRSAKDTLAAVAVSNLVAAYIHQNMKSSSLSFLCGAVVASAGAAAGMAYYAGGTAEQVEFAAQNVLASLGGMFCDGAKPDCALKGASGVLTAIKSFEMAMNNDFIKNEGIAGDSLLKTVHNLSYIQKKTALHMDKAIYTAVCDNCHC